MKQDKKLIIISLILALVAAVPLSIPLSPIPIQINGLFLAAIPLSVAIFWILIPWIMAYSLDANARSEVHIRSCRRSIESLRERRHVHYQAKFRKNTEGGTEWHIRNTGANDWEQAILLIEHELGGKKVHEKVEVSNLKPQMSFTFQSSIPFDVQGRWRTLVITEYGHALDLPDLWKPVHDWRLDTHLS